VYFPLSAFDIGLWIAFTTIILLTASELLPFYSEHFGDLVIEKNRLRLVAFLFGASFVVVVLLRIIVSPPPSG